MTDLFNEFSSQIEQIGRKHGISRVFNDLLTMGICSFHRTNIQSQLTEKDEANEKLYFETIKPYTKEELSELAKALSLLQLNLVRNPYSDMLGEYFTKYITKGQNGQFFTPEPVCQLMAKMTYSESMEGQRILDPACGSGRMQLAAAEHNHKNYFYGADNDKTCAKMATINFFLNGLKGEVAWMDSLAMEWYGGWQINMNGLGIVPIEKEQSQIWTEAPKSKPPEFKPKSDGAKSEPAKQLTLF